jgi:ABC-type sugar transport system substrate-binding protein
MHIAFVSSALSPAGDDASESFDFFALLLGGIVRNAQDKHSVTVFVPRKHGADDSDQPAVLAKCLETSPFDVIVIAPFKVKEVREVLERFFAAQVAPPDQPADVQLKGIVFVDKVVDFQAHPLKLPANFLLKSIGCQNEEGGELAADILKHAFDSRTIDPKNRRLMVLDGLEGSKERVIGFKKHAGNIMPDVPIVTPNDKLLNFTRGDARQWMLRQVNALRESRISAFGSLDGLLAWGIFACNDEMALGIRSIVSNQYRRLRTRFGKQFDLNLAEIHDDEHLIKEFELLRFLQRIRIVGFDGIAPAIDLIKPNVGAYALKVDVDPWLIGTIQTHVEDQSAAAVDWINLLRDKPGEAEQTQGIQTVKVTPVVHLATH